MLQVHRKQYLMVCYGEDHKDLAGSETSCMHGSFLHGNREALYLAPVYKLYKKIDTILYAC